MGIVNAGAMPIYEDIPQPMRKYAEEVVLNKSEDGKHVERLLAFAEEEKERKAAGGGTVKVANKLEWREKPIKADHLTAALAAVPRRATSPSPLRPAARGAASLIAARLASAGAAHLLARQGHLRVHRRGRRGGAPALRHAARGDRGAADGRHERRRRPLWRGQDVPAAGHQVGARDEEGSRVPAPLPRGGEGARRQGARGAGPRRAGGEGQGHHRARHRQGGRARHRQEHCRRRARLQQL